MTARCARWSLLAALALFLWSVLAVAGPSELDPELAVVNADTIRLSDLRLELARMQSQRQGDAPLAVAPTANVLKRLIQNRLLEQEGYRLGFDRAPDVVGDIDDAVRRQSMAALLDSVALAVPDQTANRDEARRGAVSAYVEALKKRYGVKVDAQLLASLDYASPDSLVQKQLRTRDDVVATVPGGRLTVKGLTRHIRLTYFHGLQGRADAAATRDKMCDEWVVEAVLATEARARGCANQPDIRRMARLMERQLVRDAALSGLLSFTFKPKDKEIEAFYRGHLAEFTPAPRIKVESALLDKEAAAKSFRDRLREGAKFRWLVERTPAVQQGVRPFPAEWLETRALGLQPGEAVAGRVLDPYEVPGGWAVALIGEVEKTVPTSLASSRERVVALMKAQRTRETLAEALRRLEAAARIRTAPDALARIERDLAELRASGGKR